MKQNHLSESTANIELDLFSAVSAFRLSNKSVWFSSGNHIVPEVVDDNFDHIREKGFASFKFKEIVKEIYRNTFLHSFYKLFTSAAL